MLRLFFRSIKPKIKKILNKSSSPITNQRNINNEIEERKNLRTKIKIKLKEKNKFKISCESTMF